ncbi:hypothetical protein GCM10009864_47470 [Streptomyces lunalinharesii]|uniref:Uncharacterized protein n=1 Tax=Streptomyces lunalinharesii TaxID=333384 RepID=A0ABN3S9U4_9ACTN
MLRSYWAAPQKAARAGRRCSLCEAIWSFSVTHAPGAEPPARVREALAAQGAIFVVRGVPGVHR